MSKLVTKWVFVFVLVAAFASAPARAQDHDDELKVYAVSIINDLPFRRTLSGFGVYLGHGTILTAAHVLGNYKILSNPIIEIAGQELAAKVIKKGAFPQNDLALLSIDEETLPMSLRLRRNPLCKFPLTVGANVIIVYPEKTVRSKIISPQSISTEHRIAFGSLINDVQGSGSGAFHAERRCLLGIMSASVPTYDNKGEVGHAGYFVSASKIAEFFPAEFRY